MAAALNGITVLDLTSYLAGPYGCALLGDVGAKIIKIEAPGGDAMRTYPSTIAEECRAFVGANRNKRSIVINLKVSEGRQAFYDMVKRADVVVHNFRPGVPKALGIDYETLKMHKLDLIYCGLTGFGETGPLAKHPGYDQMLQCFSGIAWFQGEERGSPEVLRGSIVDFYSSALIAFGISAALVRRERTGEGASVDLSLLRSAIALQPGRFVWTEREGRDVKREPAMGRISGAFPTKEGFLYLQASTPRFWSALCEILGKPELAQDPRFDTVRKRFDRADEIMPQICAALLEKPALVWEELMIGQVPCVAVREIEDMFDHPQVQDQRLVEEHDHPLIGRYRSMSTALTMDGVSIPTSRAPMLGEHSDEILKEFGFSEEIVSTLRACGALG
tara:strand:+ start:550 stop:1719 length:1170 start_codon:yes stop_codon:yes gene_type:complete